MVAGIELQQDELVGRVQLQLRESQVHVPQGIGVEQCRLLDELLVVGKKPLRRLAKIPLGATIKLSAPIGSVGRYQRFKEDAIEDHPEILLQGVRLFCSFDLTRVVLGLVVESQPIEQEQQGKHH